MRSLIDRETLLTVSLYLYLDKEFFRSSSRRFRRWFGTITNITAEIMAEDATGKHSKAFCNGHIQYNGQVWYKMP